MPRHFKTSRQAQRERSQALILAAARELLTRDGYDAMTLRGLSVATGLSTGAIAKRFSTKADIWRAAMGSEPPDETILRRNAVLEGLLRELVFALGVGGPRVERAVRAAETMLATLDTEATPSGAGGRAAQDRDR
ncbi:helix-turn-helix domain-containing protein [Brevundimonas bacteroides]|uniref:helix-turn-helix domain-containing protein n=1 Tax=Brevundimonas bacteroides TaxID=74311 RepID=UPI000494E381|nr:helix-turn-helix domain-containing protein [Brevundimonas bacteroides]